MSFSTSYPEVKNYIGGHYVSNGQPRRDIISPIDGRKLSSAPMSGRRDLDAAVEAATAAFKIWSMVPIKERVQVFFRYKTLMEVHLQELATMVHMENGKTMEEATAEIEKSIELTEFACSMPQLISGEVMEVSRGVECRTEKKPLGVVASIAPFNFPHMVPHWTVPNAIVLGNAIDRKSVV